MHIEHIRHFLRRNGAKPCHEGRVLRAWTQGLALDSGPVAAENYFPNALRAALPLLDAELAALLRIQSEHEGTDASSRLLQGKYAVMNFIPFNPVEGGVAGEAYCRPSLERCQALTLQLYRKGILAKLRQSAGQEIAGACGQLRARHAATAAFPAPS